MGNHQQYARMTLPNPQRHVVPTAVLTQSKLVPITTARPVTTVVPKNNVTRPRQAKIVVTKPYLPPRKHINCSQSPKACNFPPKVTAAKAPMGNPQHVLKDKGVIDSGCSRHMTGNMSYLFDFEKLNGRYVAFGGNPKGGKISGKDENQVLYRVPRKNNMYNVDLKSIVLFGALTCLFVKETLDESNLWHRRLGHINFKTMNKLVKGNLVSGLPANFFENDHTCVACKKGKQHRASCKTKPNLFFVPMESLSPQVVSAAKLPILNPNEFDLWKIRIEQYFHMTDYLLWDVILNGDSPALTRVIEGVVQPIAPTTAEKAKSKDKGKGILEEEPKPLKKQAQIEQDEAYARELEAELNKNIN
uniref:GAG-pre-integrase domain-containing protein n=1 Tax=Tanacetum cinerariifolium TaxID=118510 RepID=A0A699IAB3_TANCI|nr:hypothetical protein [Tanacetum cinerariifolium]